MRVLRIDSYEDFIRAIFEPRTNLPSGDRWYWADDLEIEIDPLKAIEYFIELFENPGHVFERFTREEREKGFDSLIDPNFDLEPGILVWDKDLPFESRRRLLLAMVDLYRNVFSREAYDCSSSMWWDHLAYAFTCGNAVRGRTEEETQLQDAMFEAIEQILQLPNEDSQDAALHGINHLHHPEGPKAVEEFISGSTNLSRERRDFAEGSAKGEYM
jgi:hypothetical protein